MGAALGPVDIEPGYGLGVFLNWLGFNSGLGFTPVEQRIIEQLRLPLKNY